MKFLYDLITIVWVAALLVSIFVTASFASKAFHISVFAALLIVVLLLKIF